MLSLIKQNWTVNIIQALLEGETENLIFLQCFPLHVNKRPFLFHAVIEANTIFTNIFLKTNKMKKSWLVFVYVLPLWPASSHLKLTSSHISWKLDNRHSWASPSQFSHTIESILSTLSKCWHTVILLLPSDSLLKETYRTLVWNLNSKN